MHGADARPGAVHGPGVGVTDRGPGVGDGCPEHGADAWARSTRPAPESRAVGQVSPEGAPNMGTGRTPGGAVHGPGAGVTGRGPSVGGGCPEHAARVERRGRGARPARVVAGRVPGSGCTGTWLRGLGPRVAVCGAGSRGVVHEPSAGASAHLPGVGVAARGPSAEATASGPTAGATAWVCACGAAGRHEPRAVCPAAARPQPPRHRPSSSSVRAMSVADAPNMAPGPSAGAAVCGPRAWATGRVPGSRCTGARLRGPGAVAPGQELGSRVYGAAPPGRGP